MAIPDRVRLRIQGRRPVGHGLGIEEDEIGDGARLDPTAFLETDVRRRLGGHLADGILERQNPCSRT